MTKTTFWSSLRARERSALCCYIKAVLAQRKRILSSREVVGSMPQSQSFLSVSLVLHRDWRWSRKYPTPSTGLTARPLAGSLCLLDASVGDFSEEACGFSVAQPDGTQLLFPTPRQININLIAKNSFQETDPWKHVCGVCCGLLHFFWAQQGSLLIKSNFPGFTSGFCIALIPILIVLFMTEMLKETNYTIMTQTHSGCIH